MDDQIQKEMLDKVGAVVSVLAEKLGVASEFVFEAAKWSVVGETIGTILVFVFIFIMLHKAKGVLEKVAKPVKNEYREFPGYEFCWLSYYMAWIIACIVFVVSFPQITATIASPSFATIEKVMDLVKDNKRK